MPEKFDFRRRLIHKAAELPPFDKRSQKRAEWFVNEAGIEMYLKKGGQYLDIGTGKGHVIQRILEDMEKSDSPLGGYYGVDITDKPLEKVQERERVRKRSSAKDKNPMNFVWSPAENLPFADRSFDGVSCIFSIHHMDKDHIDKVFDELKRVIKQDGYIFIAEDIVETEEQRQITEKIDRRLNLERRDAEHHYKSDQEWGKYFNSRGLKVKHKKLFQSKSKRGTVQHGFYVVKFRD